MLFVDCLHFIQAIRHFYKKMAPAAGLPCVTRPIGLRYSRTPLKCVVEPMWFVFVKIKKQIDFSICLSSFLRFFCKMPFVDCLHFIQAIRHFYKKMAPAARLPCVTRPTGLRYSRTPLKCVVEPMWFVFVKTKKADWFLNLLIQLPTLFL